MSESETETTQEGTEPDVETEIAEQMTPDEGETPDVVAPNPDEEEVTPTGPGPESPFQPPELNPEEDNEPDEPEALEDYAPGVAEARLMSEREAEALGKKLDGAQKTYRNRLVVLLGDDLGGHIDCPVCMDGLPGFIIHPEIAPLDTEIRTRMMQLLGLDDWEHMPSASWAAKCETCDGFGKIKTGSKVTGREVTGCEDCGESGWRNLRVPAQVNGNTDTVPSAVTGPTVAQDSEPDPRVKALREEGYMVIPRVPVATGE